MSEIDDGGPAFPRVEAPDSYPVHEGMSLRDWFAGQALSGVLVGAEVGKLTPEQRAFVFSKMASLIYETADVMLKARALPEEKL